MNIKTLDELERYLYLSNDPIHKVAHELLCKLENERDEYEKALDDYGHFA